ncbi:hypothetical protein H6P81_000113 [Aristolochia fimbriata]|uniref:Uncharacterized protein n=1 Tax=Aristolochia fimbriata TaxID=158543 RepID=A0AAV7F5L5_ARIFI|nr:hypothetical protein H6P81_000113 [Aristolochia fimbriata]
MDDFRSKSCGDGRMQMENYGNMPPAAGYDLRCYSTSYASSYPTQMPKEIKFKKGKSTGSSSKGWSLNDPELQRKKRVASYKILPSSLRMVVIVILDQSWRIHSKEISYLSRLALVIKSLVLLHVLSAMNLAVQPL